MQHPSNRDRDRARARGLRPLACALSLCLTAACSLACEGGTTSSDATNAADSATAAAPGAAVNAGAGASAQYPGPGEDGGRIATAAGLRFWVPNEWESEPVESSMRVAQFKLPGPGGDASLIMYRFPGGGSAQANIARWAMQIQQPDGAPSTDVAKTQRLEREGLVLTRLDVAGRFVGQEMPNVAPQPAIESARLLALVIEGVGSPRFFKLLGPKETVDSHIERWEKFLDSIGLAPEDAAG